MEYCHVIIVIWCLLISVSCLGYEDEEDSSLNCHRALTSVERDWRLENGYLETRGHKFFKNEYAKINNTHYRVCICNHETCLRKCCPDGQGYLKNSSECFTFNDSSLSHFTSALYNFNMTMKSGINNSHIIYGHICTGKRYLLRPGDYNILENGQMIDKISKVHELDNFCIEFREDNNRTVLVAIPCYTPPLDIRNLFVSISLLISAIFLLVTFLVYASVPELRNLHGLCLMCHVFSLSVGFTCLSLSLLYKDIIGKALCQAMGFIMQFSLLAAFFWVNVMSFDIFLTFSGAKGIERHFPRRENKMFQLYSCYAWGGSFIFLAASLVTEFTSVPDKFKPGFAYNPCWFYKVWSGVLYFYGPVGLLLLSNIIFFGLTAKIIFSSHKDGEVFKRENSGRHEGKDSKNSRRFLLYFKLFLIMGISWILDVISWTLPFEGWIWMIPDVFNSFEGIFIFWITVYNKKTKEKILTQARKKDSVSRSISSETKQSSFQRDIHIRDMHLQPKNQENDVAQTVSQSDI